LDRFGGDKVDIPKSARSGAVHRRVMLFRAAVPAQHGEPTAAAQSGANGIIAAALCKNK